MHVNRYLCVDGQITSYSALLGQIIGSLRQQKRLGQADMAAALSISQASYSRLEGGKSTWSIDQLVLVSRKLNYEVSKIIHILEHRADDLTQAAHVKVIAAGRANSRGAEERNGTGGALLAGAALSALLATLITKK